MTLYWKHYSGFPRIALVHNAVIDERFNCANGVEVLEISATAATFTSDGLSIPIDNNSAFHTLQSGSIVSINDMGIIFVAYTPTEDDATIFVTGHCNSNCVMCPSSDMERKNGDGMSEDWMREYLSLLPDSLGHITITGGEPTLRTDHFFEIVDRIADQFPDTESLLLTNGRSFAAQKFVMRLASHCPQYLRVAIPIHGHTPNLHDSITQVSGSFNQTCLGIRNLLHNKISVELRVVVSKLNLQVLPEIASFIAANFPSVTVVNFIGLETRGSCAKNYDLVFCEYKDSAPLIISAIKILTQNGIDAAIYNYPLCYVERGYWSICKKSISPDKVRFLPECEMCEARSACGGFFSTTLSMSKPIVYPIRF